MKKEEKIIYKIKEVKRRFLCQLMLMILQFQRRKYT